MREGQKSIGATRREFIRDVLGGAAWVCVASGQDRPQRILVTGKVTESASKLPLAGVCVSNGYAVVTTGKEGAYRLEIEDPRYPFVFVNPPAGFRPQESHYHRVKGGGQGVADFVLDPAPERVGTRVRLVHVSDTHINRHDRSNFASEINVAEDYLRIVEECRPDFIVNTGDFTNDGTRESMEAYLAAVHSVNVPVFTVYGNHDGDADRAANHQDADGSDNGVYKSVMGPDQYSFDWGPCHFIVCGMYWLGRPFRLPRLTKWLAQDLESNGGSRPAALFTHAKSRWFPEILETWGPNMRELQAGGTSLLMHGDDHLTHAYRHQGMVLVAAPTLCVGPIDGSARGYAVVTIDGPNIDVQFRAMKAKEFVAGATPPAPSGSPSLPEIWRRDTGNSLHRTPLVLSGTSLLLSRSDREGLRNPGVAALDAMTGSVLWDYPTEATVKNSISVANADSKNLANTGYFVEAHGRLHCINLDTGRSKWRTELPYFPDRYIYIPPLILGDKVYISQHTATYEFDAMNGRLNWQVGRHWEENRSAVYTAPVASGETIYYLVTEMLGYHGVAGISRSSGLVVWQRRLKVPTNSYPKKFFQGQFADLLVVGEKLIVPGSMDRIVALRLDTGEVVWDEPVVRDEGPMTGPAPSGYYVALEYAQGIVHQNGVLYVTTSNGRAYAAEVATGKRLWRFATHRAPLIDCQPYYRGRGNVFTKPVISNGALFFGGADGYLYKLDCTSGKLWTEWNFHVPITCPPAVMESRLYIASFDGAVRCLEIAGA